MDTVDKGFDPNEEKNEEVNGLQPEWENPPTVFDLKQDMEGVLSDHQSQTAKIDNWLDYYHARGAARPKKVKGRSNYVPKLIRKQAEWRYSSLAEPFLSNNNLFDGMPRTWEDEDGAKMHRTILNYQFETFIDKVSFINKFVRHSVDRGTVIIKTGWNFQEEEVTETEQVFDIVPAITPEQLEVANQLIELYEQNPSKFIDYYPRAYMQALELSQESETIHIPVKTEKTKEVTYSKTILNHPTAEICNHHDVIIDSSCRDNPENAKFVIHRFETSLGDLRKDGSYENLDDIEVDKLGNDILHADFRTANNNTFNFKDTARKRFYAYEYWGEWDIDSTGHLVPIVATFVGNVMIRLEENPYPEAGAHPFVFGSHLPVDESVYGEPDGELIKDDQTLLGAFMRGIIDTMARTATGQKGVERNALDTIQMSNFKNGEDFVYNPDIDPERAFFTQQYPELPQSVMLMMQNVTNDAESFTGVKSFGSTGVSGQALGSTATGVRSALDATAKRDLDILRRLANTLVKIGRKFVAMNKVFLEDGEVVRITNNSFVKINRNLLDSNLDLRLTVNTAESDNQKVERLAYMLQTMGNNGDMSMIKEILGKLFDLEKMPDLAHNIRNFEPQPDPIEMELRQLEVEKLKKEIENIQADTIEKFGKDGLNTVKASEAQAKAAKASLDLLEQESGVTQERELQRHQAQAEGNMKLETLKATLAKQTNTQKSKSQ